MKTIVVGYDGSEEAERALERAADVAQAFSAHLVVVSVTSGDVPRPGAPLEPAGPVLVPPAAAGPLVVGGGVPLPEPEPEALPDPEEAAQRQLEGARRALGRRRVEADYVPELGEPAERLLDVAERRHADLIVVGSREHGFLERLLGHAVDQTVARRADRDVLLVH